MSRRRFREPTSEYVCGVLVGRITDGQENPRGKSPHYEILVDAAGTPYRVAVNVQSVDDSEVWVYFDNKYSDDTKLGLSKLAYGAHGFEELTKGVGGDGPDYLRDNLFPLDKCPAVCRAASSVPMLRSSHPVPIAIAGLSVDCGINKTPLLRTVHGGLISADLPHRQRHLRHSHVFH